MSNRHFRESEDNTTHWLERAAAVLQVRITDGVRAAGHDAIRPSHAAVFGNLDREGTRLTHMAERAVMTPQAMGELVDDLARKGYVERIPDPTDRRAKLIRLTPSGEDAVQAAYDAIMVIEADLEAILGRTTLVRLRKALRTIAGAPASG